MRELKNVLEHAKIRSEGSIYITEEHLPPDIVREAKAFQGRPLRRKLLSVIRGETPEAPM